MRKAVIVETPEGLYDVCLVRFDGSYDEPLRTFHTTKEAVTFIENNGFDFL